jgi:hypothetical protein
LGSWHSATELLPLSGRFKYIKDRALCARSKWASLRIPDSTARCTAIHSKRRSVIIRAAWSEKKTASVYCNSRRSRFAIDLLARTRPTLANTMIKQQIVSSKTALKYQKYASWVGNWVDQVESRSLSYPEGMPLAAALRGSLSSRFRAHCV